MYTTINLPKVANHFFTLQCHGVNKEGMRCSFIRRASKSPSVSPTLASQPTFAGPAFLPSPAAVSAPTGKCSVAGCGQTRLADDCTHRICRKHCIEMMGGCSSKKHKPVVAHAPPLLTPAVAYAPPPSGPITVSTTPRQPPSSITIPPASRSPSPQIIDARADPRFATHLCPIFTQAITDQQEKLRQQTTLDAELKEKAQKAKQRITLYLWTTEDAPPTIKIIQDFTWPYLTITSSLLASVGLLQASEGGNLRIYDEDGIQDWVAIDVGYVTEVHEGQRVFLKDASLRKCVDFHKSLDSRPPTSTPHLHRHLAREQGYSYCQRKCGLAWCREYDMFA